MFDVRTIQEIFELVRSYFNPPEETRSLTADVQIDIQGEGGGEWTIHFENLDYQVIPGQIESPDIRFSIGAEDCLALVNGTLNPVTAYMLRRFDFIGDMKLANQLRRMFDFPTGTILDKWKI